MSLAGLKKQINKANQYVTEKMGAAEATKLDDVYNEMERKIETTNELVEDLIVKTREYLQPNAASWWWNPLGTAGAGPGAASAQTVAKARGTPAGKTAYPHAEGVLGESMLKHGKSLGTDCDFGRALITCGEGFGKLSDAKNALSDNVSQNFLDPLGLLQNKELKEVNHHRKKLQGRRLDYDCKKRQQRKDEEMRLSEEKLEESKQLAELAIHNVLDNDIEQISQLCALVNAQLDYHRNCTSILDQLVQDMHEHVAASQRRDRVEHSPIAVLGDEARTPNSRSPLPPKTLNGAPTANSIATAPAPTSADPWNSDPWSGNTASAPPPYSAQPSVNSTASAPSKPSAKALFDFEALNEGELGLKEGQIVTLSSQIDENWFEGYLADGRSGFFPINYVTVVVPLPK